MLQIWNWEGIHQEPLEEYEEGPILLEKAGIKESGEAEIEGRNTRIRIEDDG